MKRYRDISKLEPKALERKLVDYAGGDNDNCCTYPHTLRNVVAVRDTVIKEFEVGAILDNTVMLDLLEEGSQQLGRWNPDDGHQDDGIK